MKSFKNTAIAIDTENPVQLQKVEIGKTIRAFGN